MEITATPSRQIDTGLIGLVMLARFYGKAAEPEQIRHQFGAHGKAFDSTDILRAARSLDLKAREVTSSWERLAKTPMPALALRTDGRYVVIGAAKADEVLLQDPTEDRPKTLSREEFAGIWTGRLILFATRGFLNNIAGKFDLSWFIPSLVKYRKLLGEVLLGVFFPSTPGADNTALLSGGHRQSAGPSGLSTLDVLAVGLLVVSAFEVVLGGLRTYLFSHTASRVDVELGAKLYRHLQGLPVAFFLSRPVGTIVARVRELESIRNFLTSSALTLLIDVVFTVVFFAVMYVYTPLLFWIVVGTIPLYVGLSVFVTPMLRRRLDEKFQRGAENQAFLVESVSGAETIKAMAIEPQMQRRWEEQLAGYVSSSLRATNLGNIANQIAGFVSKVTTVLILWVGATSGDQRSTDGGRTGRLQHVLPDG